MTCMNLTYKMIVNFPLVTMSVNPLLPVSQEVCIHFLKLLSYFGRIYIAAVKKNDFL